MKKAVVALEWRDGVLRILDQRKLPGQIQWIEASTVETVAHSIETLAVRGAPAIGIAAGYGVAIAAQSSRISKSRLQSAVARLRRTRPTGYNLFHVLQQMSELIDVEEDDLRESLLRLAIRIHEDDAKSCLSMAKHGLKLFGSKERVLTYCNTGALATGGIGTALGVIKHAFSKGKVVEVFACETRPIGQGARLTVWECAESGIPVTLICDNMAASLMQSGKVDRVLVGADRIARNGDTSNKIGTLNVATLCHVHKIPFHVVAPASTFDLSLRSGKEITIEQRDGKEITRGTPGLDRVSGVQVWNPAFDITPTKYITNFITNLGVLRPPFRW